MLSRSSYVNTINVKVASYSSVLQLGDSCIINGLSRALAVQREEEQDYGNEGNFAAYSVFSESIPFTPITENFCSQTHHLNPIIKVNHVNVIGFSSSAVLHVGNSQTISMEARVKHIRQLLPRQR
ncbi:spore germination protein GerPE [Neobacillus sp. PS3-12]|jgi:spore germination protein PE|uniref:spore germination protein GerPE n=1 Tax=Neobacillus sp. PS3-12 TaxID=3070677 RepID=UPI0027DF4C39|nr:spore germination protein GerPE [Neobacillus sp. PS3-12]WML51529.1 spore germination protein GerPE [Neobacillus sp. PS3-12]